MTGSGGKVPLSSLVGCVTLATFLQLQLSFIKCKILIISKALLGGFSTILCARHGTGRILNQIAAIIITKNFETGIMPSECAGQCQTLTYLMNKDIIL